MSYGGKEPWHHVHPSESDGEYAQHWRGVQDAHEQIPYDMHHIEKDSGANGTCTMRPPAAPKASNHAWATASTAREPLMASGPALMVPLLVSEMGTATMGLVQKGGPNNERGG